MKNSIRKMSQKMVINTDKIDAVAQVVDRQLTEIATLKWTWTLVPATTTAASMSTENDVGGKHPSPLVV